MNEIEEGLQLLVLGREFPTGSGPVDVLAMDSEAVLYLIETKLYNNADKRRVVAQVLDYGAALWAAGPATVSASLLAFVSAGGAALRERLQKTFDLSEDEASETLEKLSLNIRAGRFRFIVLMNQLDERLKDLILFLNENSEFELLAVEVDFYKAQDLEIVIPRVFGAQTRKRTVASSSHWTHEDVLKDLNSHDLRPDHLKLLVGHSTLPNALK